jgi:hypothetical protein
VLPPFELTVERAPADPEQPRRNRLVAPHLLQRADDVVALHFDERCGVDGARPRGAVRPRIRNDSGNRRRRRHHELHLQLLHAPFEIRVGDEVAFRKNAGALDHVAQLPHVAVPARVAQHALGAGREADERLAEPL